MAGQDHSGDEVYAGQSQDPPTVPGSRNAARTQAATAEQLEQAETRIEGRMSAFERSMLRLTRYGLAVTIVTGIIFLMQLYEMISGGTQTDKLVGYSKTQAQASKDIATAAGNFSTTAENAVTEFKNAAAESTKAANEAVRNTRTSITNAQNSFRDDQRAWLGVLALTDFVAKPGEESTGWIVAQNSGRTPALHVHMNVTGVSLPVGTQPFFHYAAQEPTAVNKQFCCAAPGPVAGQSPIWAPLYNRPKLTRSRQGHTYCTYTGKFTIQTCFVAPTTQLFASL